VEVLSGTVVYAGCGWMFGRRRVEFLEHTGKLKSTKESSWTTICAVRIEMVRFVVE
jgi:hypothetical protein